MNWVSQVKSFVTSIYRAMATKPMGDIAGLRINYEGRAHIDVDTLSVKDPIKLFDKWFTEARECKDIRNEVNAMTLATCTKSGFPAARTVLLKGYDDNGFKFFTNYNSRKGCEIAENPNVALSFYWGPIHQCVRIEGVAQRLSQAESEEYFHSRPHGSQIGACVSNQSQPIPSSQVLLDRFKELNDKYPTEEHTVQKPEHWGGYLVVPKLIEFWQGQSNRVHNRIQFIKDTGNLSETDILHKGDNDWFYQLLSP